MLQNIREHIQGWFATVIIIVVALSFALFGIQSYLQGDNPKLATVAVVEGEKITAMQLQQRYHRLLEQTPNANALTGKARLALQNQALKQLIHETALLQVAEDLGLTVSATELKAFIMQMPAFQVEGHFSLPRFNQVIAFNGLSLQQFEQEIRQMLLLTQLQALVQMGSFVLPAEAQQAYALLEQKRDLDYLELSNKHFAQNFQPTQAQVESYYKAHLSRFMQPERVSIAYVELSPQQLVATIKLSDAELKAYYEEHRANFPASKSFAELKPSLVKALNQEKTEQLLAEKSEELANLSFTNPESLEVVSKTLKLPIEHTPLFDRKGVAVGVLADPKVVAAAFSEEVLAQDNNSSPIELKNGGLIVLRVDQHKAARAQPLAELRPVIEGLLKQEEAKTLSYQAAAKIEAALNAGQSEALVAKNYKLNWIKKPGISLGDQAVPAPIVAAAFKVAFDGSNPSKAQLVSLPDGYAIVRVVAHQWGQAAHLSEAEQKAWLAQLAAHQSEIEYQLYVQALVEEAKVKLKKAPAPKEF